LLPDPFHSWCQRVDVPKKALTNWAALARPVPRASAQSLAWDAGEDPPCYWVRQAAKATTAPVATKIWRRPGRPSSRRAPKTAGSACRNVRGSKSLPSSTRISPSHTTYRHSDSDVVVGTRSTRASGRLPLSAQEATKRRRAASIFAPHLARFILQAFSDRPSMLFSRTPAAFCRGQAPSRFTLICDLPLLLHWVLPSNPRGCKGADDTRLAVKAGSAQRLPACRAHRSGLERRGAHRCRHERGEAWLLTPSCCVRSSPHSAKPQ
jgi:hypothetical protein